MHINSVMSRVCFFGAIMAMLASIYLFRQASAGMDEYMAKRTIEYRAELAKATSDDEKCGLMGDIAKDDVNRGKLAEARQYATKVLEFAAKMKDKGSGSYGVAIHDGNMVLGRIALKEKKVELAKQYLLKAGKTPGAPTLDSFGPNMSLAKDLLEVGEKDAVIEYFHECRKFWDFHLDKLTEWEAEVKSGGIPDFGANLIY